MHIDPSRPTRQPPWRRLCRRLPGDPLSRRCQSSAGQVGHPQSPDQGLVAAAPSPNLPHSPTSRRAGTAPPAFNPHSPSAVKSKQILYEVRDSLLPEQLCVSTPQRILWVSIPSSSGQLSAPHPYRTPVLAPFQNLVSVALNPSLPECPGQTLRSAPKALSSTPLRVRQSKTGLNVGGTQQPG